MAYPMLFLAHEGVTVGFDDFDVAGEFSDLSNVAVKFGLDPATLTIDSMALAMHPRTFAGTNLRHRLRTIHSTDCQKGSTKENPIPLSGIAAGSTPPGSLGEAARTPEAKLLLKWPRQQELDVSSKQAFQEWMNRAPVSARTKHFFLNHVCELPDLKDKCILGYSFSDEMAGIREDYTDLLLGLGRQHYSILVLSSARRTGKSVGCLNSLLIARKQLLNKADKLVVLATGADLPMDNLKTILCISMLCGLPMVLDELFDIRACAKGIKAYVEDAAYRDCDKPALSVAVIGSEMQAIHNAAITALGGLHHMGVAPVTLLPAPTLGVIVTMLEHRRPHLQGDNFAAAVLSALTLSGPNLMEHWTGSPRVEDLASSSICNVTYLPSELARVLSRINSGSGIEQNANSLCMLAEFGFIRPRVVAGKVKAHMYDYINYRLITFQELLKWPHNDDVQGAIEKAEGRVLEEVLRTHEGSRLLAEVLGLQVALDANKLVFYHGQLAAGKEVDLLIVEKVGVTADQADYCNLFMCSAKRSESQQEVKSFTEHLGKLYKLSKEMVQHLLRAQRLTFVAISCIPNKDGVAHVESRLPRSCRLPLCESPHQQQQQQQDGTQLQQQEEVTTAVGSAGEQEQCDEEGTVGSSVTATTVGKDKCSSSSSSTVSLGKPARQLKQQVQEVAAVAPAGEQDQQREEDNVNIRMILSAEDGSSSSSSMLQDGIIAVPLAAVPPAVDDDQQPMQGKDGSTRTVMALERDRSSNSSSRQGAGITTTTADALAAKVEQQENTLNSSKTAGAAAAAEAQRAVTIPVDCRVARVLFEDLLKVAKRMPLAKVYSISL